VTDTDILLNVLAAKSWISR